MVGKSDKVILGVPYYSQFNIIRNKDWQPRACTVVNLKMLMDFLVPEIQISADELFEESEEIKQSMLDKELITPKLAGNGSVHDCVVFLAHNHGLPAHKEEFKSLNPEFQEKMLDFGIKKIADSVKSGKPVIVSILPGLSNGQSFHTILIIGTETEEGSKNSIKGFYYHDPDALTETLENQYLDLNKFLSYWRRLAIFFN